MSTENFKDVRRFVELEKELDLFKRSYNGFFYWQHIRFDVCESLFGNRIANVSAESGGEKKSLAKLCVKYGRESIEAIKTSIRLMKKERSELVILLGPKTSDKFFDSWDVPEEISHTSFRYIPYTTEKKEGDLFLEPPRLRFVFEKKIRGKLGLFKEDKAEKRALKKLEDRLKKDFGQSLSADEMERRIQELIIFDKHYTRYFSKLFRRTRCRAAAFTCYYSPELISAAKAAKKSGVKMIELQHGVINNHEEYWFEDNRGLHNYVPDILLTFGDIHNSWIKLVKGKKAVSVGFPFQEKSIRELENVQPNDKYIVIYPESFPEFENVLDRFINEITPLGYKVFIKLHPLQAKNVSLWYPVLSKNKNAEIVTRQTEGIYYWLKMAKHHVMSSTTVGLEAVAFDHSNICIAENVPHDQVQCLLDWKIARGFSTAQQLKELVLHPLDIRTEQAVKARKKLWKDNASENMAAFFREMKRNDRVIESENRSERNSNGRIKR